MCSCCLRLRCFEFTCSVYRWCTVKNYVKVKPSLYTPWRRLGGEEYSSYSFTTSALDRGEWSASRPGRAFSPGERTPGTHCTGGWVGPRVGLDTEDRGNILCLCRGSNPDRPVVQPVVRHYTDWATRLLKNYVRTENYVDFNQRIVTAHCDTVIVLARHPSV
jgi:hypothetical protein